MFTAPILTSRRAVLNGRHCLLRANSASCGFLHRLERLLLWLPQEFRHVWMYRNNYYTMKSRFSLTASQSLDPPFVWVPDSSGVPSGFPDSFVWGPQFVYDPQFLGVLSNFCGSVYVPESTVRLRYKIRLGEVPNFSRVPNSFGSRFCLGSPICLTSPIYRGPQFVEMKSRLFTLVPFSKRTPHDTVYDRVDARVETAEKAKPAD